MKKYCGAGMGANVWERTRAAAHVAGGGSAATNVRIILSVNYKLIEDATTIMHCIPRNYIYY